MKSFEKDRHDDDDDEDADGNKPTFPQNEQQQQQHSQHSPTLYKTGGKKRVALLQTLALISMALMQQKLATASAAAANFANGAGASVDVQQHVMEKETGVVVNVIQTLEEDERTLSPAKQHEASNKMWSMLDSEIDSHNDQYDDEDDDNLVVMDTTDDTCEYFSTEDDHDEAEKSNNNNNNNSDIETEDILIVSTVDGSLTGISRSTGEVLWKQRGRGAIKRTHQQQQQTHPSEDKDDEKSARWNTKRSSPRIPKDAESEAPPSILEPLVSTTTTIQSSTSDWRTAAVPSMDGSTVYLTAAAAAATEKTDRNVDETDNGGSGDVTVTASLRELVNRAPFVDSRGRIYTGSRKSVAVAIDGNTGQVLQVVSADQPFFSSSSTTASSSKKKHDASSSSSNFFPNNNNNKHDSSSSSSSSNDNDDNECHARWQGRNVVWIGRIDHSISIHEPRSGNVDVQFSAAQIMSVNDMVLGQTHSQPPWTSSTSNAFFSKQQQHHHTHMLPSSGSHTADPFVEQRETTRSSSSILVATPNGNLALRNPQTGQMIWVSKERFDSPVAFAVDAATGESLSVDLIPDAVAPNGSLDYLSREMKRQFDIMTSNDVNNIVDNDDSASSSSSSSSHDEQTIVGSLPNGQLFAMPLGRKGASASGRSAGSSLYHHHHHHHQQPAITASATAQNKPRPLVSRIAQLIQRQNPQQQQQQSQHHHPIVKPTKKACMPGMPNFPGCLVMSKNHDRITASSLANQQQYHNQHQHHQHHGSFLSDASFTASHQRFMNQPYLQQQYQHYLMGQAGEQNNAVVPFDDTEHYGYHYSHPPHHHFYSTLTANQDRNRKKYQKLLKILGSWLPPTIALIFVVSFELGRRKRQNDASSNADVNAITNGGGSGSESFSGGNNNNYSNNGSAMTDCGVIQVFDNEILGYGGHGTVVYKGLLDGRQVAVKRMLKAYHASADREISLLIESDGHPNVVRYFLKEVRGDFVYLALELCDLSLHDLIGNLKSMYDQMEKENQMPPNNSIVAAHNNTVSPSIKAILLQIANGVKHLHGLRIVHRDLKPANILLADARKSKRKNKDSTVESVYAIFQHGDYVAKISDMGLGKQIIGQSSYGGASTMLESSSLMHGGGVQQSSIAGAGPGSVGWQAPEVMAMRVVSIDNSSVRSNEGSTMGAFCASGTPDASPLDVTGSAHTSRSIDIFSLGCIFYSTLVPASHPFGEWYEREANIMHNRPNMKALEDLSPDAYDLVASMLHRTPSCRPTAKLICDHPFFWAPDRRLMFLCDFSDRLESEVADGDGNMSSACIALQVRVERSAAKVVGTSWATNIDESLISNVQRFRTYDPSSIRDLLRLIRNKHHHYDELPLELKTSMGSNTDGLMNYFDVRFPLLLIHCFNVCRELIPSDDTFACKYSIARTNSNRRLLDRKVTPIIETTITTAIVLADSPPSTDPVPSEPVMDNDQTSDKEACAAKENGSLGAQANVPPIASDELDSSDSEEVPDTVAEDECVPKSIDNKDEEERPCLNQESTEDVKDIAPAVDAGDMVIWEGSSAAKMFNNRGWNRSDDEWIRRTDAAIRRPTNNNNNTILARCATDPKFRTRLCNHWDASQGTFCPMRKKNKCVFAHGPAELRVKENKRNRWGKLVDKNGDTKNPRHSGGEDTYGAARMIETERKGEGKWNVGKANQQQSKGGGKKPNAPKKKDAISTKVPE